MMVVSENALHALRSTRLLIVKSRDVRPRVLKSALHCLCHFTLSLPRKKNVSVGSKAFTLLTCRCRRHSDAKGVRASNTAPLLALPLYSWRRSPVTSQKTNYVPAVFLTFVIRPKRKSDFAVSVMSSSDLSQVFYTAAADATSRRIVIRVYIQFILVWLFFSCCGLLFLFLLFVALLSYGIDLRFKEISLLNGWPRSLCDMPRGWSDQPQSLEVLATKQWHEQKRKMRSSLSIEGTLKHALELSRCVCVSSHTTALSLLIAMQFIEIPHWWFPPYRQRETCWVIAGYNNINNYSSGSSSTDERHL